MKIIASKNKKNSTQLIFLLFVIPAFVVFSAVIYYPLISSFVYSFTDWDMGSTTLNYIGLKNFFYMFEDKLVMAGFKNTFLFAAYSTFVGNALALLLAIVLDRNLKTKNFLRTVFYLPCLLSPIVVSAVFSDILQYNGLFNEVFNRLGLTFLVNDWFGNASTALPMLIMLNAWQWAGYGSVIYLAGLQIIPAEFYEAARIDGSNRFNIFFRITLPLLMPSITIMTFMSITGGLKLFDIPYVLTNGGPGTATETVATVIYRMAFNQDRFGYATAISVVFFIVIAFFSINQVRFTRKREVQL
jgi:raffinose/stachyose/melibiose transport system permease protein